MKAVKLLAIIMVATFSYTAVSAQVHHPVHHRKHHWHRKRHKM